MSYNDERTMMMHQGRAQAGIIARHAATIQTADCSDLPALYTAILQDVRDHKGFIYDHLSPHDILLKAIDQADTLDFMDYIADRYIL